MHTLMGSSTLLCAFAWLLLSLSASGQCAAQQLFHFLQDGTGDILAALEITEAPADDLGDFGALSFSDKGNDIFGFGLTYDSAFSTLEGSVEVSNGRLQASSTGGVLRDLEADETALNPDPASSFFFLTFPFDASLDLARIHYEGRPMGTGGVVAGVSGVWQLVPEPGGLVLCVSTGLLVCGGPGCLRSRI